MAEANESPGVSGEALPPATVVLIVDARSVTKRVRQFVGCGDEGTASFAPADGRSMRFALLTASYALTDVACWACQPSLPSYPRPEVFDMDMLCRMR
jgi:hypothetical protein